VAIKRCIRHWTQLCRRSKAFSVVGPTVWNSLPTTFRSLSVSCGNFRVTHA